LKKSFLILSLSVLFILYSCWINKTGKKALYELDRSPAGNAGKDSLAIIDAGLPEIGNAEAGLQYLLQGNGFRNGIPLGLYRSIERLKNTRLAGWAGFNKYSLNDFVVFKNEEGNMIATPGCLHCHAQEFNNQLVIGLGNSYSIFQVNTTRFLALAETAIKLHYGKNSAEWKATKKTFESAYVLAPAIITQMQGPTPAHQIAEIMASHRDPRTLVFRADTTYFSVPPIIIPVDPPALWLSKKKKAFTINAMEQGSFLKHLMSPTILSFKDSSEAREIYEHIKDVWAYLVSLQPPEYPFPINQPLAEEGRRIFEKTCSPCHGTYGEKEYYPNRLVPAKVIGTDSLMWKYYAEHTGYAEWFNRSWFADSDPPAYIKPQAGYVPPPLNGVWMTAPYFHNGSVPSIEGVLNSDERPRYWKRDFNSNEYDYEKLGWKYKRLSRPRGKKTYNTRVPGYGNYGHYFGDGLSEHERKAVVEYLKRL
jgi:Cytochrome c